MVTLEWKAAQSPILTVFTSRSLLLRRYHYDILERRAFIYHAHERSAQFPFPHLLTPVMDRFLRIVSETHRNIPPGRGEAPSTYMC